jgi:hypothetical protein
MFNYIRYRLFDDIKRLPYQFRRLNRRRKLFNKFKKHYYDNFDLCDAIPNILFDMFIEFYEKWKQPEINDHIEWNLEETDENGWNGSHWAEVYKAMKQTYQLIKEIRWLEQFAEYAHTYIHKKYPTKMNWTPVGDGAMGSLSFIPKENDEKVTPLLLYIHDLEMRLENKKLKACMLISKYHQFMWD